MKWVILDRDGVINEDSDAYIKSPEEWEAIPGSLEAIELLTRHGYRLVVITNQSGIARGYFNEEVLAKIHAKMVREVIPHPLDSFMVRAGKRTDLKPAPKEQQKIA